MSTVRLSRSSFSELPAMCGVMMTLGSPHNSLSAGNGSWEVVSRAAPAIRPVRSADTKALCSTKRPREVTIILAEGFIIES